MAKNTAASEIEAINKYIVKGIQEKKGSDITVLDLRGTGNAIADYFVICTGNSDTQLDAIKDSIEEEVFKGTGQHPWHREGIQNKEWILLDFVETVVHIFKRSVREFYGLEELWGDAERVVIEDPS
jgi:ribosome-associated protein